jgi:hypothetical protein
MVTIAILSALVILLFRFEAHSYDESNDSILAGGVDPGHHGRRHALTKPASTPPATA